MEKARADIKGGKQAAVKPGPLNPIAKISEWRDAALADAGDDVSKIQRIEDAYQRQVDAIPISPVARSQDANPSITATIQKAINAVKSQVRRELKGSTIETARKTLSDLAEKTAAQASSVNARAALRASKAFGSDVADDAAEEILESLRSTVDGTAINANSLEDLDIGAIRQAFNDSLGTVRDGIRKTFDDGVGVSAENAGKKAAASSDDDVLSKLFIPEQVADDLVSYTGAMSKSPALAGFENAIDRFLGHWKAAMTIDWPAFHSRNYVSGQVYNFLSGAWSFASHAASWKLVLGKNANGLQKIKEFSTLTDAQASRKLREELFVNDVANHDHGMHFIPELASKQKGLLGQSPVFRGPGVDTTRLERANPLNLEAFAPHRIGQDAARFTEGLNRVTPYIELRKKGWTPQAAAKRVNEIQVNYKSSAVADKLMGRLFPFWKFSKGMVPFTLKELGQKPGGGIAQTMRAANRARGTDELTPDYVADTTSIPLGKLPDGSNRYITGLGLPFEDVFSLVNANDPQSSGREVLSRMNPLIKGPAELFTGQSFFQKGPIGGRPIEDLDPTIGRTLSNIGQLAKDPKRILFGGEHESVDPVQTSRLAEFVLSNSPLSRATTTARVASDPRKGLGAKAANLLTGFKVADVSPASQDALLREEAAKAMKRLGGKSFTRTYIPKDRREKMSPEAQLDALLLDSLMSELARRAKERKAARTR